MSRLAYLGCGMGLPDINAAIVNAGNAAYFGFTDPIYGVDIWAGIRFAKPPVGSLRLQPPQPNEASGKISSLEYGNRCFELGDGLTPFGATRVGNNSEDCLVLNIYAPPRHLGLEGLPIMFYLHGGSFNLGSGNDYMAQSLVNHSIDLNSPVIVITSNYRLNLLGFPGRSLIFI
jgi:carboxylesterase type B